MKRAFVAVALILLLSAVSQSKNKPESLMTVRIGDAYQSKMALLASPFGQRCTTNCYSGELECLSTDARNFQVGDASDGNIYELRCELGSAPNGSAACPIAPGTYEVRKEKNSLRLRIPGEAREREFAILNVRRKSETGDSTAIAVDRTSHTPRVAVMYSGQDEIGMKFADELRRQFKWSNEYRVSDVESKGWIVKVVAEPASSAMPARSVMSVVAYFLGENGAQAPVSHSVHLAGSSDYGQAANLVFREINDKIKANPPCRSGVATKK